MSIMSAPRGKLLGIVSFLTIIVLTACSAEPPAAQPTATQAQQSPTSIQATPTPFRNLMAGLDTPFEIKIGETAFIDTQGYRMDFRGVKEESRCQVGTRCIQPGRAVIEIGVNTGGAGEGLVIELILETRRDDLATTIVGPYAIKLLSLGPYPGTFEGQPDHTATLAVSNAELDVSVDGRLASANAEFGFDLFSRLAEQDAGKNLFMSPLSVSIALAMTYNGAAGETQKAMSNALKFRDMNLEDVNRAILALRRILLDLNPEIAVNIANSLWAREGVEFKADFLERNRQFIGAEVTSLDFGDPEVAGVINRWVDKKTGGKIDSVIDRISPDQVMFLINAIYFNGTWLFPFDEDKTTERTFHLSDGTEKQHPMMSHSGKKFLYLKSEDFQALKLPYRKPQVGMFIFLPDPESDLDEFLGHLNDENWNDWMSQFKVGMGEVVIPRFKMEYEARLDDALKRMGMEIAFSEGADFSAMAPGGLFIDEVKHKAVVEVNEVGTEAAAVTTVAVAVSAPNLRFDFVVDRPFFFAISDDNTDTVLFMGAVYAPEE